MLISLAEYAKRVNRDHATIRQRILRGTLPAIKIGRNWCIEEDTPLTDTRTKSEDSHPTAAPGRQIPGKKEEKNNE